MEPRTKQFLGDALAVVASELVVRTRTFTTQCFVLVRVVTTVVVGVAEISSIDAGVSRRTFLVTVIT
jgi:hypothetical protein